MFDRWSTGGDGSKSTFLRAATGLWPEAIAGAQLLSMVLQQLHESLNLQHDQAAVQSRSTAAERSHHSIVPTPGLELCVCLGALNAELEGHGAGAASELL